MNCCHSLAQSLDDAAHSSVCAPLLSLLSRKTLADTLGPVPRGVAFHPFLALCALLAVYLLFLLVFVPLWLASFLLTSLGSLLLLALLWHWLNVYVTRNIAFAGSSIFVQKQMAADIVRRVSLFLERVAVSTNEHASVLLLVVSERLSLREAPGCIQQLQQLWLAAQHFENVASYLEDARKQTSSSPSPSVSVPVPVPVSVPLSLSLSTEEERLLARLCAALPAFSQSFQRLMLLIPHMPHRPGPHTHTHTHTHAHAHANSNNNKETAMQASISQATAQLLRASEELRVSALSVRPSGATGSQMEDEGLLTMAAKMLGSLRSEIDSFERLAFPYMRAILRHKFHARFFSVDVGGGVTVDCVHFPQPQPQPHSQSSHSQSQSQTETETQSHTQSPPRTPARGLVFFCGPNAAYYELVSQVDQSKSWFGLYRSLGFDICMFNYRGYGRSGGSPSPSAVKADAERVLAQVRRELQMSSHTHTHTVPTIVHGESIGGMTAAHLARHCEGVDALVCDRTFTSLDAAACRLMGNWAGFCMRWFSWWNSHVVADFLAVKCPKIILQDPMDEIIADGASLRSGVAKQLMLRDKLCRFDHDPADYLRARYSKSDDVFSRGERILHECTSAEGLTEEFVAHLHFCCTVVSGTDDFSSLGNNSRKSAAETMDLEESRGLMSDHQFTATLTTERERHRQSSLAWVALGSLCAEHGQTLSASLNRGYDGFRSWLCSLCLWESSLALSTPSNIADVQSSIENILDREQEQRPASVSALQFIAKALSLLQAKRKEKKSAGSEANLGVLLPLTCGHNGWPSDEELKKYTQWINQLPGSA